MEKSVVLKKYSNRRLYDTEKSKYVTLEEVSAMIKAGLVVEIFDAQTQEDVTAFVLTQIILEEAKKKNFILPVPVLHLIIRFGDNALGEFMEKYMYKTIQNYLKFKTAFDEQMKQWLDLGMNVSDIMSKSKDIQSPFADMMNLFSSLKKTDDLKPEKSEYNDTIKKNI
jgi:polyhydroxyalkanoate synthesis repressor PhaR